MTASGDRAKRIRVLGIGNPDRGDDGVGPAVLRALERRRPSGVDLRIRDGDMLALIDDFDGGDAVICVDAAAGERAGRIHRIDLAEEALPRDVAFVSSHAFGLPEAFALAEALGALPERLLVYAVEGSRFEHGSAMSPAVAAAVEDVAKRLVAEIERLASRLPEVSADA